MSDLISRKALLEQIKLANSRSFLGETTNGFNLSGIEIVGIIKDMPTAYDVDKVVENVKKNAIAEDEVLYVNGDEFTYFVRLDEVIDIVKGGLKE